MKNKILFLMVLIVPSLEAMLSPSAPAIKLLNQVRSVSTLRQQLLPVVSTKETHDKLRILSKKYYKYATQEKSLLHASPYEAFTFNQCRGIHEIFKAGLVGLGDRWLEANGFHWCQQALHFDRVGKRFKEFVQEEIFEGDKPFVVDVELSATASPRYAFGVHVVLQKWIADIWLKRVLAAIATLPYNASPAQTEQRILTEVVADTQHFDERLLDVADRIEGITKAGMKINGDLMQYCKDPIHFPSGM